MAAEEIIKDARFVLQDTLDPYRFPTADLVRALQGAYDLLKRKRADLFIGRLVSDAALPITATSDLSFLSDSYRQQLTHLIVGKVLGIENDEDGQRSAEGHHKLAREL